jgi:hypothetical protein
MLHDFARSDFPKKRKVEIVFPIKPTRKMTGKTTSRILRLVLSGYLSSDNTSLLLVEEFMAD